MERRYTFWEAWYTEPSICRTVCNAEKNWWVAYRLDLPAELSSVHNVFHASNLRKCLSGEKLVVPLDEIKVDEQLRIIEEPVEIFDFKARNLRQSKVYIVKARWNFNRGLEFTWEREDQMKLKYPHLFEKATPVIVEAS